MLLLYLFFDKKNRTYLVLNLEPFFATASLHYQTVISILLSSRAELEREGNTLTEERETRGGERKGERELDGRSRPNH